MSTPHVLGTACVCLCVCVARRRAKRKGDGVHVFVRVPIYQRQRLRACGHGDKRKNKIKATNMHPLPLLGWLSQGEGPTGGLRAPPAPLASLGAGGHEMPDSSSSGPEQPGPAALWICWAFPTQRHTWRWHAASYVILKWRMENRRRFLTLTWTAFVKPSKLPAWRPCPLGRDDQAVARS